jgi:hypothetical protein
VLLGGLQRFSPRTFAAGDPDLDRFHTVTDTGLLSSGELDAVADAVWGKPACRKARKTTGEKPIVMRLRDAFAQSPTALNAASGAITPLSDHNFPAG